MSVLQYANYLELNKCPHCRIDKPNLTTRASFLTHEFGTSRQLYWKVYACNRCGGAVTVSSYHNNGTVIEIFPNLTEVSTTIPSPAREYLLQAIDCLHSPAGCVMLSASAIDAMLKNKSYKEGSLYARINKAAEDHLITKEMAEWAHDVRLDANDQRHADDGALLISIDDAQKCIHFALALSEFLFVLPARVQRRGLPEVDKK